VADKRWNNLKSNYEITFDASSEIKRVDDDRDIKIMSFAFVKISTLPNTEVNSNVDILGIIKSAGDCVEISSKKNPGSVLLKRDLVVMDDSGVDVRVTLWAEKHSKNIIGMIIPLLRLNL